MRRQDRLESAEVELGLIELASRCDGPRPGRQAERAQNLHDRVVFGDERDEFEAVAVASRAGKSVDSETPCGQPDTAANSTSNTRFNNCAQESLLRRRAGKSST